MNYTTSVWQSFYKKNLIFLAAKYPKLVAAMYLDAPVVNLLSCPCGLGDADDSMFEEFFGHFKLTKSQMLNYKEHPANYLHNFLKSKIPTFLVAGNSDKKCPTTKMDKLLTSSLKKTI